MTTSFLPGLEDLAPPADPPPPGVTGWDLGFWIVRNHPKKRLLLEALCRRTKGRASACSPTAGTLARELGMSTKAVRTHLAGMVRMGVLRSAANPRIVAQRVLSFPFLDAPRQESERGPDHRGARAPIIGEPGPRSSGSPHRRTHGRPTGCADPRFPS